MPSWRTRCSKCEIIMIELRVVMPKSVTKPTSEPSESEPPVAKTASTPPMRANGRLTSTRSKFLVLLNTMLSSRMMPTPAMAECSNSSRFAAACASPEPPNAG